MKFRVHLVMKTTTAVACMHIPEVKPPPPLKLGAGVRDDWKRGKEDWDNYSIIQDLPSKPADVQLALFRVALGPDARKLLQNQPVPRNEMALNGTKHRSRHS